MDFGKHLGKLGKIFKLSNGELMTVLPPDENHFLNQLKEKGLKATLMLDSTTNFDEVKSYTKSTPVSQVNKKTYLNKTFKTFSLMILQLIYIQVF